VFYLGLEVNNMRKTQNKSIKITQESYEMLKLMAKATNSKMNAFLSEMVKEIFNVFCVYKPHGVQIFYEGSIYPEVYLKLTFTGKRALTVGKTTEEALEQELLRVESETKHE